MKLCTCCGAAPVLKYGPFCVGCNDDWMNSDEWATAEHVEAMALETFKARVRERKRAVSKRLDAAGVR